MLIEMINLQERLNDETNGKEWRSGFAKNGKLINWRRCIYMECAELMDSFAWKHWKNVSAPTDKANAKMEIVDIWHFVMSMGLERYSAEELAQNIINTLGFKEFCEEVFDLNSYNIYEVLSEVETLIHRTSALSCGFGELLYHYFRLALKCEVNLFELYRIYIGKNVLNKFRQDNGYQSGTYVKIWNGVEDNEVLNGILSRGVMGFEEIYKALEEAYVQIAECGMRSAE